MLLVAGARVAGARCLDEREQRVAELRVCRFVAQGVDQKPGGDARRRGRVVSQLPLQTSTLAVGRVDTGERAVRAGHHVVRVEQLRPDLVGQLPQQEALQHLALTRRQPAPRRLGFVAQPGGDDGQRLAAGVVGDVNDLHAGVLVDGGVVAAGERLAEPVVAGEDRAVGDLVVAVDERGDGRGQRHRVAGGLHRELLDFAAGRGEDDAGQRDHGREHIPRVRERGDGLLFGGLGCVQLGGHRGETCVCFALGSFGRGDERLVELGETRRHLGVLGEHGVDGCGQRLT